MGYGYELLPWIIMFIYSHYNGDCNTTMVSDIVCLSSLCNPCVACVFLPDFNASPHVRKKRKKTAHAVRVGCGSINWMV